MDLLVVEILIRVVELPNLFSLIPTHPKKQKKDVKK